MLTKPDLCSMALLKLGEQPIQSFQDDTASAKLARTLFDSVIDTLLLQHPWHFATTEIRLIKNSNNEFLIPANVLRVLKTDGRILGNSIQSDQDSILINAIIQFMKIMMTLFLKIKENIISLQDMVINLIPVLIILITPRIFI